MIGTNLSHYRIEKELGRGGMGVVYLATDTKLDRQVALKLLPASALTNEHDKERFYREAKAAAQLHHPHIASVFEIDEAVPEGAPSDELRPFIAMEFIEGISLEDRIREGPLTVKESVRIASEIAEALKAAHEKDIVHRDIKSANVMLAKDHRAKVLDFGLAKTTQSTMLTRMGSTLGTIAYMSPEQARGEDVDHRTDLWALGVVIYEMIAGRLPFGGDYEQAIVYSILNEDPNPLTAIRTGVPMDLDWIVGKLFSKDASHRYNSADDLIVDLKNVTERPSRMSGHHASLTDGIAAPQAQGSANSALLSRRWVLPSIAGAVMLLLGWFAASLTGGAGGSAGSLPMELSMVFDEINYISHPAFTPDGKSMLFYAYDNRDGTPGAYEYDLSTASLSLIPSSEDFGAMSFSPDGSMIAVAMFTNEVSVMRPDGSGVSVIGEASNSDVVWSSDSSILLDPQDGILREVYLDGREEVIIAEPDTSVGERFYWWPQPLPDDRYILFTVLYDETDERYGEVRILDREMGDQMLVVDDGQHAKYVPSGHLLYQLHESDQVVVRAFDLENMEVTGPPFNLFFSSMHSVEWSAEDMLIYQAEKQSFRTRLYPLNDPEDVTLIEMKEDEIWGLTPTGNLTKTVESDEGEDLKLIAPGSTFERRVVSDDEIITPVFSNDETRVAYISDDGSQLLIKIVDANGGDVLQSHRLGEYEDVDLESWSSDGSSILFSGTIRRDDDSRTLAFIDPESGDISEFVKAGTGLSSAEFSPDGRFVAFTTESGGKAQTIIAPSDGSGQISLDTDLVFDDWSLDSQSIYVTDITNVTDREVFRYYFDTRGTIRLTGQIESVVKSDRLAGVYVIADGTVLVLESADRLDENNSINVITNASQYLETLAPTE